MNEEIEANIQITREIESDICKCSEIESALAVRESELTKTLYVSHFEIDGLSTVTSKFILLVISLIYLFLELVKIHDCLLARIFKLDFTWRKIRIIIA